VYVGAISELGQLHPLVEPGVTVVVGTVAAVSGALSGVWITHRFAVGKTLSETRTAARHSLAQLYVLIWPPTGYAVLLAALDKLDGDLMDAGVPLRLRTAIAEIAVECWTDGAAGTSVNRPSGGIATKLLEAYRLLRTAVLLELSPRKRRRRVEFQDDVLRRVERLGAETREDRSRRIPPVLDEAQRRPAPLIP
jgi:hypothetical protein